MKLTKKQFEDSIKNKSSRHHYIPQFLVKGFTNNRGLIYIYDKKEDKILEQQRAPKNVFFEWNRNTFNLEEGVDCSVIEDKFYSWIDNFISPTIKYFRETDIKAVDFTSENIGNLKMFICNLFWRIPYTDSAVEDLLDRSNYLSSESYQDELKKDPAIRKIQRSNLHFHTIKEIMKSKDRGHEWVNAHQNIDYPFVLGDNPILFRRLPKDFIDLGNLEYLFAISSNRIISFSNQKMEYFNSLDLFVFNAAIIHQSVRYVGCKDLELLKISIEFNKYLIKQGILLNAIDQLFENNSVNK